MLGKLLGTRHNRIVRPVETIIDTGQARALIAKENAQKATQSELAALENWRFYRRPTKRYQFFLKRPYDYAFSEYGERLGIIENFGGKGLHILGDNGISYYGLKVDIDFSNMSILTVANYKYWEKIEKMRL